MDLQRKDVTEHDVFLNSNLPEPGSVFVVRHIEPVFWGGNADLPDFKIGSRITTS